MSPRETPASISALRLSVSTLLPPHCAAAGVAAARSASAANFMLVLVIAETPNSTSPRRRTAKRLEGPHAPPEAAAHPNPRQSVAPPYHSGRSLGPMEKFFTFCATRISTVAGQPLAFVIALMLINIWGAT